MKFQDTVLSGLSRRYYTSANKALRGSEADKALRPFARGRHVTFLALHIESSSLVVTVLGIVLEYGLSA